MATQPSYQTGMLPLSSLTGTETVVVGNGGPRVTTVTTAQIASVASAQYQTNAATASATLTAANIGGPNAGVVPDSVYLALTGTLTGAANATLPTVAALATALGATTGSSYLLRIINESSGNYAWTVATATGWTLNGTMSINQNTFRDFLVTFTSATAATLQTVGTGTFS